MNVYYIRLVNGSEIISQIEEIENQPNIHLRDPMLVETSQDQMGNSLIYMSRLNAFCNVDDLVPISKGHIQITIKASNVVSSYYNRVLDFSRNYMDRRFERGIKECISIVDQRMKQISDMLKTMNMEDLMETGYEEKEEEEKDNGLDNKSSKNKLH